MKSCTEQKARRSALEYWGPWLDTSLQCHLDKAKEEGREEDSGTLIMLERLQQAPSGGTRQQGTDPTATTFYHRHFT